MYVLNVKSTPCYEYTRKKFGGDGWGSPHVYVVPHIIL